LTQNANLQEWDAIRPLSHREFEEFRSLAHRTFGLDLKAGKEELVSARLRKLVRGSGLRSFQEYYRQVVEDSTGRTLASMIDALTTNHTSFLREPDHFDFLRQRLSSEFANSERLEIWSAACSTGEEVWTLACLLNDCLGPNRGRILATDISNRVLKAASEGCYGADRCAGIPAAWLSRYFMAEGRPARSYRIAPAIRAQVQFQRVNLVERISLARQFPVIFCRNVMIYFDRRTQEHVVGQLAEFLEPGGYLFVGHAESLTRVSHHLEYVRPAVYRKPAGKEHRWTKSS